LDTPHSELTAFWQRPLDPAETFDYQIDVQKDLQRDSDTIDSVAWSVSSEAAAVNLGAVDATTDAYIAKATISFTSAPATEDVHNRTFDIIADITTVGGKLLRRVRKILVRVANSALSRQYTLVELAELKTWLNITDDDHDWALLDLETRTRTYIENQTGRIFVGAERDFTEYFCGNGMRHGLYLSNEPVDGFTDFTVEFRDSLSSAWVEQQDDYGFEVKGNPGGREILSLDRIWPIGAWNIRVTYKVGMAGDYPRDLVGLALEICGKSWRERQTITPSAVVGQETIIPLRVPTTSQAVLDYYRVKPMRGIGR
jgi:hypothetical protein